MCRPDLDGRPTDIPNQLCPKFVLKVEKGAGRVFLTGQIFWK